MYIPISFTYHMHSEKDPGPIVVRYLGTDTRPFITLDFGNSVSVFVTDKQLEALRLAIVAYQDAQILQPVEGGLLTAEDLADKAELPTQWANAEDVQL
jgi:hypothetical protein